MASTFMLCKKNLVLNVEMREQVLQVDVFGNQKDAYNCVVDAGTERDEGRVMLFDGIYDLIHGFMLNCIGFILRDEQFD